MFSEKRTLRVINQVHQRLYEIDRETSDTFKEHSREKVAESHSIDYTQRTLIDRNRILLNLLSLAA